jgi:MHS family alpha-ketoglutarate permease-like MFS transporter
MQAPVSTLSPKTAKQHLRSIITGSAGNLIEWYDWYIYAVFSLYFASTFFPQGDETAQLLNTAGIFAIGFLMRPIGGWLLGTYADRKGRKAALTLSVWMMSAGSLLITVVPGYKQIGIAAPLMLVLARMFQGVSVGGEYGTVATYLSEIAPPKRRGLYSSFQYVTGTLGQLIALGILMLLQHLLLSQQQMMDWGWRVPFGLGALLSICAVYLRRDMVESASFTHETISIKNRGSFKELAKYKREVFIIIGFTLGATVAFYTFSSYMQKFLVNTCGFSKNDSALINLIALFIFMLAQPLAGMLGDRIGRKRLMLIYGVLALLTSLPIMILLSHTHQFWVAAGLVILALLIMSLNTSISAILKAELFPVNIRSLGVSLPYALTVAIFGGTAEYIALWFKKIGHSQWFFWYLTLCIAISFIAIILMPNAEKKSKMDGNSN